MPEGTSWLARIRDFFNGSNTKSLVSSEGSWRGPFFGIGELGSAFPIEPIGDGWQKNLQISQFQARHVPTVYACVMAIARAISQCYPTHVRKANSTIEKTTTTAAYRTLNNPNTYQTTPDFLLNLVATALFEGEAFALGARNERNEIVTIHPMQNGTTQIRIAEDGSIFYAFGSSDLAQTEPDFIAPARDVLHLKFHTPRHPLIGETPIKAAAMAIGINVALSRSQTAFFTQMNRPSGVLSTDQSLTKEQMLRLREAFDAQSKLWAQGGMPILSNGLKFQPLSISSEDAQLIDAQKMSIDEICRVYGVPPPLIGELSESSLNNAETIIHYFLSISLGSYLEHTERAFDRLFGLGTNEYIELDTSALLRTDFNGRIDGLSKAVQGSIMTPNEARGKEGLGPIEGGDQAFLQRQMIPVSMINDLAKQEIEAANAPPPEPQAPPATPDSQAPPVPPAKSDELSPMMSRALFDYCYSESIS